MAITDKLKKLKSISESLARVRAKEAEIFKSLATKQDLKEVADRVNSFEIDPESIKKEVTKAVDLKVEEVTAKFENLKDIDVEKINNQLDNASSKLEKLDTLQNDVNRKFVEINNDIQTQNTDLIVLKSQFEVTKNQVSTLEQGVEEDRQFLAERIKDMTNTITSNKKEVDENKKEADENTEVAAEMFKRHDASIKALENDVSAAISEIIDTMFEVQAGFENHVSKMAEHLSPVVVEETKASVENHESDNVESQDQNYEEVIHAPAPEPESSSWF